LLVGLAAAATRARYGGGEPFPDRSPEPDRQPATLEVVAELDHPPGQLAASPRGRLFLTFHPEGSPQTKLAELKDGVAAAYPTAQLQERRDDGPWLDTPLGLRLDRRGRLWVLDSGRHGRGDPKLLAIDTASGAVVREQHFSAELAPLGSYLSDLAVHPHGDRIYLADASILRKSPALLVFDLRNGRVRRVLEGRAAVAAAAYRITVDGEPVARWGLFTLRPGVSSLAIDASGQWLYFAAAAANKLYRARTRDLDDASLTDEQLAERVQAVGEKTVSSALAVGPGGAIYLGDPEHHAVAWLEKGGGLHTWLRDPRLRWPASLCFAPTGWLYVSASALGQLALRSDEQVAARAPYLVLRASADPRPAAR